jgi:hypothetical protein
MTTRIDTQAIPPPPSLAMLARTTAIALAVAGVLLVIAVLPAEYAVDPTGIGRRLGLTEIASPTVTVVDDMKSHAGAALVPTQAGPIGQYPAEFKFDVVEITLQPYEYVEYKYRLERGATMLYAWSASAAVIQDFHGERAVGASAEGPLEVSFDKSNRRQATGSFAAPFAGIHGWYWENPGSDVVTIRLTSSGYYSAAVEIRSDRSRHPHTLRSLGTLSPVAEPSAATAQ